MADKIDVEVTGRSKYEIAHQIAINIISGCEDSSISKVGRKHYLNAVADAIDALHSIRPK